MGYGLMTIYVEIQDASGSSNISVQELMQFANQYGLSCPVLADGMGQLWGHYVGGSIPSFALIKYDGTVLLYDDWNAINNQINNAIPPYGGPAGW